MSSTAPVSPAAEVWPVWTDFVDNWRAVDAHWFRARVVNMFDNATARTNANMGTPLIGALSYLQDVDSLEMYKSTGVWESVRYPNLAVASTTGPPATVALRQTAAGSGIILQSDGVAAIEKLNAGLGVLNVTSTGAAIKTGAKTVLLTTDATALAVDSPVKVTGTLSATGALSAPSAALTGALTAATVTGTGQVQGATVVATGQSSGATGLFGTIAMASNQSGWAAFGHNSQPSRGFWAGSGGEAQVIGATVTLNGPVTAANVITLSSGGKINPGNVDMAGLVITNRAPGGGDTQRDGTIWIVA